MLHPNIHHDGTDWEAASVRLISSCCSGEGISIGSVCAAELTAAIWGRLDLQDQIITATAAEDGEDQPIALGTYRVTRCQDGGGYTEITAYDAAYYALGGDYTPGSTSQVPGTALTVLRDICAQTGLALGDVSGLTDQPVTGDLTGHTCREMAGYMAALLGCNVVISRDGKLSLRWFTDNGQTLTPDDYYSSGLKLDGETVLAGLRVTKKVRRTGTVGGMTTETETTETLEAGAGSGMVIDIENPYATQQSVDAVWNKISGLDVYRTGTCAAFGGLLTEPGEVVQITDLQDNTAAMPIMRVTLELDGGCKATLDSCGQSVTETSANVGGPVGKALTRIEADIAAFKELTAENAKIQQATIQRLMTSEIKSTNYREITMPYIYPASGLYPAANVYPSDGRTIVEGYRIDLATGTMYGNWTFLTDLTQRLERLEQLESGPLYPRAALYPG